MTVEIARRTGSDSQEKLVEIYGSIVVLIEDSEYMARDEMKSVSTLENESSVLVELLLAKNTRFIFLVFDFFVVTNKAFLVHSSSREISPESLNDKFEEKMIEWRRKMETGCSSNRVKIFDFCLLNGERKRSVK